MRGLRSLSIACAVDRATAWQINAGRASTPNASFDLSVVEALRRIYKTVHIVRAVPESSRTLEELSRLRPDAIFNLAFSANQIEPSFAGALDLLGIPFTGSEAAAIALANDKVRSRILLRAMGLPVPRFIELRPGPQAAIDFEPPYLVKPACLAGSAGIYANSMVKTPADVWRHAERIWKRFDVPAVCDEFIVGREFRVGLVESAPGTSSVSGIAEWRFSDAKPGWGFKTEAIRGNARVRRAQNVKRGSFAMKPKTLRSLSTIAQESMRVLGIRGYATIDFRVDAAERPIVLEVNANPGLSSRGSVWSRPSFDTNIRLVVEAALRGNEATLG